MQRETYTTKTGAVQYRPVCDEAELRHLMFDGVHGWCLSCGAEVYGIEPDARRYHCTDCNAMKVYGLEELLMMGLVRIGEVIA